MASTTIYRVLTKTDLGKSGSHGEPPIPTAKETDLQIFFGGINNKQTFTDVRHPNGKKYKLGYINRKANGRTPNDRITSINGYASDNGLLPGDTLILERIDNGTDRTYLIDYARKCSEIIFAGKKKATRTSPASAEIANMDVFSNLMTDQVSAGTVMQTAPNTYRVINVNNNGVIGDLIIRNAGNDATIDFTNGRDIIKGKETKSLSFNSGSVTFNTITDTFRIENDHPVLYNRIGNRIYEEEDAEILQNTRADDFASVSGTYTAAPEDKAEARTQNGRKVYPRKKAKSLNALKRANYQCECNAAHTTFNRKGTSIPYTEPHHLIPLHYFEDFAKSLDVEANIVSLCSNCHNQVHYGDGSAILTQLFSQRQAELATAQILTDKDGNTIDINKLLSYYKL